MSTAAKVAVGYFVAVAAVVAVVAVLAETASGPDASFVGVWAIVATLPGSLVLLRTGSPDGVAGFLLLAGVVLVQAVVVYGLVRLFTRAKRADG